MAKPRNRIKITEWVTRDKKRRTITLYRVWANMIQRCGNPNNKDFHHYGGRGITVCTHWWMFANFREWAIANGFGKGLKIDRIDNDGDYCPDNCRWSTQAEQLRNSRRTRNITFNGRTQCLADWAKEIGIDPRTLSYRIQKWGIEQAIGGRDAV